MKRLSRNALSITLSDGIRRLLGFFAVAFLARKVGASGFGLINIGFTVLSYSILACSAGLVSYGAREVARGQDSNIVSRIISFRLFLALPVCMIVIPIIWLAVGDVYEATVISFFCLSIFAHASLIDWYFQGKEEMGILGISRTLSAFVYLIAILLFVKTTGDLLWVALGALAGDSLAVITLLMRYQRRVGTISLRFEPKEWRSLFVNSFPLGAGSVMGSLTANVAPLVIGILMTNADVGIYSAASKLVFFLLMFDRVFGTILLPAATRFNTLSKELLLSKLQSAAKWIILGALPMAAGGMILSGKIVTIIYGSQYTDAVLVFQILVWYFFCTLLHTIFTSGLIAVGQEKLYSKVMTISAVVYAASIIVLTKLFGVMGAAMAMTGSEIVTLLLMWYQFQKIMQISILGHILKTIPAVIMMGLAVAYFPSAHLFVVIPAGVAVYFLAVFLTRAMTKRDVQELLERI